MAKSIIQRIVAQFDRNASKKAEREMEEALGRAGAKGGDRAGKGFLKELRDEFNKRKAQLSEELAKGTIDQREFKKQTRIAAKTFNDGLLRGIQQARAEGNLTDREYSKLARKFKYVGDQGDRHISRVSTAMDRLRNVAIAVGGVLASLWVVQRVAEYSRAIFTLGSGVLAVGNQFEAVFGRQLADNLRERTADLRRMAGLTTKQAQELFAGAGSMAQGFGMAKDASADFAQQVVELSADLASFNNVPTAEAAKLVQSALIGNTEAARSLKVAFTAADVQNRALAMTGKATAKELTQQEKALAALSVMTERAGPMIGDLARTQNDSDNAAKQHAASIQEVKDRLAALLVEGLSVVPLFRNMREGMEGVGQWVEDNQQSIRDLGTAFGEVANAIVAMVEATVTAVGWLRRVDRGMDEFVAKWGLTAGARRQAQRRLRADLYGDEGAPGGGGTSPDGAGGGGTAGGGGGGGGTSTDPNKALRDRIALLGKARDLGILTSEQIQEILRLEQETRDALANQNLALDQRVALMERLATLEGMSGDLVGQVMAPSYEMADSIYEINDKTAKKVTSIWADAHAAIYEETSAIGKSIGGLFLSWASGGLKGVAQFAKAKVLENLAWAAENFAKSMGWISLGNVPSAGAATAAAKGHLVAAAKWGVIGGGASLGGGGGGGGSGGVGTSGPTVTGPRPGMADSAVTAPEINIFIDPLDAHDPAWQEAVGAAYDRARDSYGNNARINVHPRTGRRA